MPVGFIPKIIKIGEILSPIIVKEIAKPRFQRFVREQRDEVLKFALRKGKEALTGRAKKTFIMRRGKQQFQCRKVN